MITVITDWCSISIPRWVEDVDSFLQWLDDPNIPEKITLWFLKGEVWADLTREELGTHLVVRTAVTAGLSRFVGANRLGRLCGRGVVMVNRTAGMAGNPDAVFVSNESQAARRVRQLADRDGAGVGFEGTPDMVLEVVSPGSVKKDTVTLKEAYFAAGVAEYWLVDARGEDLAFDILKHGPKGFVATRKPGGWVKSGVFGKAFKLTRGTDPQGNPEFTLEVK